MPGPAAAGRTRRRNAGCPLRRRRACCRRKPGGPPRRRAARRRRDPDAALADGDSARCRHPADDPSFVRVRVDAVDLVGELVGRPDRPLAEGDPADADLERDGVQDGLLRVGVDPPDAAADGIGDPDRAGADGERGQALGGDRDRLRGGVRPWIDLDDLPLVVDDPHFALARSDAHRPDAGNGRHDPIRPRVDPGDAQIGIDHPDSGIRHRDVRFQARPVGPRGEPRRLPGYRGIVPSTTSDSGSNRDTLSGSEVLACARRFRSRWRPRRQRGRSASSPC